jgi:phytoene/squalene synthetase
MKRIDEAVDDAGAADLEPSQRKTYERTLRALKAVGEDDEDEGIEVVTDWIVERVREDGALPGSRDVRRRAAEFCRANGYAVGDDEWLGV